MKDKILLFLFTLILFFGTGIRFLGLGSIPVALNRDEASLGYTAFSILETSKDEHGVNWPINIESFGDWKLPGYIYTLIPFIKILGLDSFSTRVPSAIAGSLIIILAGLIVFLLNKNKSLALLTTLLLAISPWGIHLSHLAYEANLALAFFLSGLLFFLLAVDHKANSKSYLEEENKKNTLWYKKSILFIFSVIFFGLTFFTYHAYQVFTPLMTICLVFFYRNHLLKLFKTKKQILIFPIFMTVLFSLALVITSYSANKIKFSGLSIFELNSYKEQMFINRAYFENRNGILAKLHSSSLSMVIDQVQKNLSKVLSAKFLFFEGGGHGSHDITGTGKLYPIQAIFILVSLVYFYKEKKQWQKIVSLWLLTSLVAPMITFQAAHSIRFSPGLTPLTIMSAYGLIKIWQYLAKQQKLINLIGKFAIFLIVLYSLTFFLLTYFFVAPNRDIDNWNWQMEKLVTMIEERKYDYNKVIMPGTQWSPYIYFLFQTKYDPKLLSTNLSYYPVDNEGFRHVKKWTNVYFKKPNWNQLEKSGEKILFVLKTEEIPADKFTNNNYSVEYTLADPWSKQKWVLLKLSNS